MCNLILTTWYYKSFCMLVWTWKYSMKKLQHTFDIEILISHILFFKLASLLESSSKEFYDWSSNVKNQKIHDTKAFFWLNLHVSNFDHQLKTKNQFNCKKAIAECKSQHLSKLNWNVQAPSSQMQTNLCFIFLVNSIQLELVLQVS